MGTAAATEPFTKTGDGADVEVWRREKGTTDAMVQVLGSGSVSLITSHLFTFASGTGNYLDDITVLKLDGDTMESEVQTYNAANEMTVQVADARTTNFSYDQFGRMTQKTRDSYTGTYYYHYGDKLTKVASNFWGEGTVTYAYSGDQKRRSRSVSGGAMTKYRVDQGWGVVNEENSGGTLLSTYVHHPGRQIGTVLATSEGSTASSGTWNYYFQDAIGSTRGLWDEDGARLGKYDYTPFGGKYGNTGEEITRKFTGHDWDSDARLYYTAYRYYSPDMGRWLTRDPLGMVDGPNVYAYVVNNPVSMWDALGNDGYLTTMATGAIMGLLGGMAGNATRQKLDNPSLPVDVRKSIEAGLITAGITIAAFLLMTPAAVALLVEVGILPPIVNWEGTELAAIVMATAFAYGLSFLVSGPVGACGVAVDVVAPGLGSFGSEVWGPAGSAYIYNDMFKNPHLYN